MEKKFVIDQKNLCSLLTAMQPICTRRTALDATSNILFHVSAKELVLKATDLEISLQSSCPVFESTIRDGIQFLVPGKRIFDIVRELDDAITLELLDNQLMINTDTVNLALNIKEAQEFPQLPERIENLMHIDAELFKNMLDGVSFLVPQNNSNPALNGLFVEVSPEQLKMTATDGHSLAQVSSPKITLDQQASWLLPRRAVFELKKVLEGNSDKIIFIGTCAQQLVFSGEHFNFFSRLLADAFPQYQSILKREGFLCATLDRSHFVKTLKRSACLLSGQFIATQFKFSDDAVHVLMNNKEVGKLNERVPLKNYTYADIDIRFYAPYLLNGLQSFDPEVQFYLQSTNKPIIFEQASEAINKIYLVMPVSPTAA